MDVTGRVFFFLKINSNALFPADIYWEISAKIKTEEPQGCPAYASWGVCCICTAESVSWMRGAPYVVQ